MSTQRKAWNEAMKKAARGTMLPIPGMPTKSRRSSSRNSRNKQRREKARKSLNFMDGDGIHGDLSGGEGGENGDGGGGSGYIDLIEFRIDALEEACNEFGGIMDGCSNSMMDDDEEYSEMEEYEESNGRSGKRKKRGGTKKKTKKSKHNSGSSSSSANNDGLLPKRFKARSLASILIEESVRGNEDGVLKDYLNAEAKPTTISTTSTTSTKSQQQSRKRRYPRRKFCCVTGLEALYKDPKTGIPYANLTALEQIRERAPPWISGMGNTGSANYYEAVRSLRNEE